MWHINLQKDTSDNMLTYVCDRVDQSEICQTVSDLSSQEAAKYCLPNAMAHTVVENVQSVSMETVTSLSPFLTVTNKMMLKNCLLLFSTNKYVVIYS